MKVHVSMKASSGISYLNQKASMFNNAKAAGDRILGYAQGTCLSPHCVQFVSTRKLVKAATIASVTIEGGLSASI
jgi:hypothetical protein